MQGTRKILVLNLPPSIHEDYLELFFENTKQYGGGPVVNVTIDKEKLTAIVEFETPDAVEKVLAKGNIQIMNQLVQVKKYNREELFIIEVKGPPSIVCEDNIEFLQLYFEHAKSNGGKVQTINIDRGRNSALITFESIEVAERVLQHTHILKQQSLKVQKFDPLQMISIEKRIRVKGVSDCGSEDALRFYFENKRRSGGGSIADIQMFHETNEAVITFENIADATSVLEKEHRLNNRTIEVSKYIPAELRPFYPDRLLIHGVKSTSSDESLANLIEAKLGTGVRQFAYHKDRDDVVLVYLQTSFDLKNTQCKIKGWSLDEAELEVFEVPVTDCIVVENIPDLILEETVVLYFDNARRSGGGNVKKTVMSADNRMCVVYFEDYSAVENVVAKEHVLNGERLRVNRYLECLCLSETNALDTSAPFSFVLCVNNYQIQNFINKSEVFQQKLEKELNHLCAGLERNEAENQTLVVFTPRKGVVSNKFQRHWKEKVMHTIAMEEAHIQIQQRQVSDTDIQNILKQLSGKERNSDNVCISFDQTNGIVSIVGFIGYIDLTIQFIDAVTDVKIKSMDTNEKRVSDFLTINNHLEMNMLQKLGVPDELKEKYPKLKVFVNETEDKISFDGSENDIRDAKLHVLETKLSLTSADCRLSESAVKLFSTEETKGFIGGKLKKANTLCEWRVQNQRLSVCCSGNSDANIIADIILLSVKEKSLSLKPEVVSISVSEMWSNIETELQERYPGKFFMHICDKARVQLYSTEDISSDIYVDLQKLVEMEETRHIDELQHASEELMSLSAEDELQQASEELKSLQGMSSAAEDDHQQTSDELKSLSDVYLMQQEEKVKGSPKEYQQLQRKKQAAAKVKYFDPLEETEHYILFKGINPKTKRENLSNFIELVAGIEVDPEKIIFSALRDCALVVVNGKPDLEACRQRAQNRGIQSYKPEIFEIEQPTRIAVSCEEEIQYKEGLELYFERPRIGGGEFKGSCIESEDGSCYVIEFKEPAAVKRICEKAKQTPYKYDGKILRVSPYYTYKGGAIWDQELHAVRIPEPFIIKLQTIYTQFLQKPCCETLVSNLKENYCKHEFCGKGLALQCTLGPTVDNLRQRVKEWETSSRDLVNSFIGEKIIERSIKVTGEHHVAIWTELMQYFDSEKIKSLPEIESSTDNKSYTIILVGFSEQVKAQDDKLASKRYEIEKRLKRKTETLPIEPLKIRLLETIGKFDEMRRDIPDIEIFLSDKEITIEGQPSDINLVKLALHEAGKISHFKWEHTFTRPCVEFIKQNLVDKLGKNLKENGVIAEWDIDFLQVHGFIYEDEGEMHETNGDACVKSRFDENEYVHVDVDNVSRVILWFKKSLAEELEIIPENVLSSTEGRVFIADVTETYDRDAGIYLTNSDKKLWIFGMSKAVKEIHKKLKQFLEENVVKEDRLKCGTIEIKLLRRYLMEEITEIQTSKKAKVMIDLEDESIKIRGTRKGIRMAKDELTKIFRSIVSRDHTIQKVAVKDVMRSEQENGRIEQIENKTKCIIQLPGEDETVFVSRRYERKEGKETRRTENVGGATGGSNEELKRGPIKIEVAVENIADQKVDVIVCSTSNNKDLSRKSASNALLRAGGKVLQDECKIMYSNNLNSWQLAEISPGSLSCKVVILTVLPKYSPEAIDKLNKVIETCMQLTEAHRLTSLAFPALGTGSLRYPPDEVCHLMFETVSRWGLNHPTTTLKTVRFIMHAKDPELIQRFKAYVHTVQGRGERKRRSLQHHDFQRPQSYHQKGDYKATGNEFDIRGIRLRVILGDILEQKTDAIVCSVSSNFEFLGGVAMALIKKCPGLANDAKKKFAKFQRDGLAILNGYQGVPARKLIHVNFVETPSKWRQQMLSCLEKANKNKLKTIAFPLLGTGQGTITINPKEIATSLFDAVDEFSKKHNYSSVKGVNLVVFKTQVHMYQPVLSSFHTAVQKAVEGKQDWFLGEKAKGFFKSAVNLITGTHPDAKSKEDFQCLSMQLKIYSHSADNIDKCIKELDLKLEQAYTRQTIGDYKDLITTLTAEEEKELDTVDFFANIKIDKSAGVISIEGLIRIVGDAKSELQKKLLKIDRRRNEQEIAQENYKLFRWYFEEITNTGFEHVEYEKVLNLRIEEAYKANKNDVEFWDDKGNCYVIDLVNLVEYPKTDRRDTVKVLRKDILKQATAALPQEWAPMKDNENLRRVNVPNTEQIYKDIEQRFLTEVRGGQYAGRIMFDKNKLQVSKIERIQNKTLYQQYMAKKRLMSEQKPNLPANMPIEQQLWLGTTHDAVDSIEMHGFNRSYCGKNGIWFGAGVYFAKCASYSARGWLTGAQSQQIGIQTGVKGYIFLSKVLTGEFCKGNDKMRYLPAVDPNKPLVLYDCAVDNVANPTEFVIFHDTQAYPEYIISFVA